MLQINKKEVSVYFDDAYGKKNIVRIYFDLLELLGHFSLSVSISLL